MSFIVEKEWTTKAGLRAVCLIILRGERKRHRCGYVAVTDDHPAFGKGYSEQLDEISQETANLAEIGQKGPMLAFTAMCGSDDEHNAIRRSLDVIIDCHGGLTYSSTSKGGDYPVKSSNLWWFGFDCAHAWDNDIEPDPNWPRIYSDGEVRSLEFVQEQCESIAAQLMTLKGQSNETH